MACFMKSEDSSIKGILNLLEFNHVIASMASVSTLRNLGMCLKSFR